MMIFLVVINIILIAAVVLLLAKQGRSKTYSFTELEDVELLEFQENLKKLIEQMKITAEKGAADMKASEKELKSGINEAEKAAKELKYLIERSRYIRSSNRRPENEILKDTEETEIKQKKKPAGDFGDFETPAKKTARFEMNDGDEAGAEKDDGSDKFGRVSRLLDRGLGVDEIVSVTGLARSEVMLIKNLKKN